jgi:1,4-alpha-glucan branching enzyme
MINLSEVGAHPVRDAAGNWHVKVGVYLPGITFDKGYRLLVRIIHEADQFIRGIEPKNFWMNWLNGSQLDLWEATVPLMADPPPSHFGQDGKYLYRYQLQRADGRDVTFWFADPFARDAGVGTLSAFAKNAPAFAWSDAAFSPPEVDEMVVYELNVREFNRDFEGVIDQLDYLRELGVNVIELMPITNVKEDVEWGYTPLSFLLAR